MGLVTGSVMNVINISVVKQCVPVGMRLDLITCIIISLLPRALKVRKIRIFLIYTLLL